MAAITALWFPVSVSGRFSDSNPGVDFTMIMNRMGSTSWLDTGRASSHKSQLKIPACIQTTKQAAMNRQAMRKNLKLFLAARAQQPQV
jgi:hypothetical protein